VIGSALSAVSQFPANIHIEIMVYWLDRSKGAGAMKMNIWVVLCSGGMLGLSAGSVLANPPDSVNWVDQGVTPPVRDQSLCGGDVAMVTAEAVDSLEAIHGVSQADTSIQQLIDCTAAYGGQGCNGADFVSGLKYIVAHGVMTNAAYGPYTASDGVCRASGGPLRIRSYTQLPRGDCDALQAAVARQPVMAAVGVNSDTSVPGFANYSGGVLTDCGANPAPNHSVLVVGYTPDYWIVQNSWGASWGENGFIRLKRGNTCGICEYAAYPKY
jgi:hypothetical protein